MSERAIPAKVREDQARAADPEASVFVAANAGSGKTHVLANRVIRLLLNGTPPERILCITFTKAAAANMAQRVFERLGEWVGLADDALDKAVVEIGARRPDPATRAQARRLFATALETPGGLKIQTIHALCTRLLQKFPFEARVASDFTVLEERERDETMERASLAVLLDAAGRPEGEFGRALAVVMAHAADVTFRDMLGDVLRQVSREAPARADDLGPALGLAPDETAETIAREIVEGPHLPPTRWRDIAARLAGGSSRDAARARDLTDALAATGGARVARYLDLFWTTSGGAAKLRDAIVTKAFAKSHPDIAALFEREQPRVAALTEKWRAAAIRARTDALMTLAGEVTRRYRREKRRRGLLDFDDLIDKTLDLLNDTDIGWVHYKLDQGIDHVLIDEAQDTSPRQWQIIARLISEFTAGAGARGPLKRTVFAVGDEKQSIFSFQGADPREFEHWRRRFAKAFAEADMKFDKVRLDLSFRSGPTILAGVDGVFQREEIHASIGSAGEGPPVHQALADAAPSAIDLWQPELPDKRDDPVGWRAPFDTVSETSAPVRLARRIAAEIDRLVAGGEWTGRLNDEDARRPLRPKDILVLVRKRGVLFDSVIQALKQRNVPVAGADRLTLTDHIAVADLMALADALLMPRDDLSLAIALKSPLFGLCANDPGEADLFALAHGRAASLRAALEHKARDDASLAAMLDRLRRYETNAARLSPFAFFADVLGGDGGRARIARRLGHEANDALDEFLEAALAYERAEPATLQGFLGWLRAAETEVKRDLEISRDEVRVMTVHGAKGLEAPVVFLPDTMSPPASRKGFRLIALRPATGDHAGKGLLVWTGRKEDDCAAVAAARAAAAKEAEDESRRLLYVAMTRAAERLIVCGYLDRNVKEVRPDSWYALIRDGLEAAPLAREELESPTGEFTRFRKPGEAWGLPGKAVSPKAAPATLPEELQRPVAPTAAAHRVLRPSDIADENVAASRAPGTRETRREARRRGILVHRLLQSLPEIAPARRREAAERFLVRNAADWSDEARARVGDRVLALIEDARFARVFGPSSRAEVPIVGKLPRADGSFVSVAGQIDRLTVTPTEVFIVDFKTNPYHPAEPPLAYSRQLALYRALLSSIYRERTVRAALLWTEASEMMEVSAQALDAELARILAP